MNEKAFLLYKTQCKSLLKLPPEQRGQLIEKIIRYAFDGEEPEEFEDLASEVLFDQIRDQIDRDTQKYKDKCDRNRKTALEREKLKREREEREKDKQNSTNVNERVQTCTNSTNKDKDTDTEKETDTNIDTEKEKESDTDITLSTVPSLEEVKQECKNNCPKMLPKANKFWTYYQGKGWPDNWKDTLKWWAETELSSGKDITNEQSERFNGERSSLKLWG